MDKKFLVRNPSTGFSEEELVSNATTSQDGFLSQEDKQIIDTVQNKNFGVVTLPTITNNLDGSITVSDDGVFIFSTEDSGDSNYFRYENVTGTSITLLDSTENYVYIDYNAGSPIFSKTTNPSLFLTKATYLPIFRIYRSGTNLNIIDYDAYAVSSSNKMMYKDVVLNGYERQSGLSLSTVDTRIPVVSAGSVWFGMKLYTIEENRAGTAGSLKYHYLSSGSWVTASVSSYDSTYYSDGTNQQTLDNNKFVSKYFYRAVGDVNNVGYVDGNQFNSFAEALAEGAPSVPQMVSAHGIYVGKIVIQKGAAIGVAYPRNWNQVYTSTPVTDHNDLANINGAFPYNHLSDTELTKLTNIEDGAQVNTVDSVNGETGTVVLDADDIDDTSTTNKFVTASDITNLGNLSGTNSGDEDVTSIKTKLGAADTDSDGYLTSTDWNTFNGKSDFDGAYSSLSGLPDLTTKADKVSGATSGNFASLDASGNLTDSGHKDTDYADASHVHTASDITDFDDEVSNNTDVAANTSSRHSPVTVTDTDEIDLTLTGQEISASIIAGSIDETKLDTSVNASLDLADSAIQSADLSEYPTLVNDAKGNFLVKGGKNYPISNVELDDLTSDYKASGNTKPYLAFENPSEDQMVDLDITPITWVNILGLKGNCEVIDSYDEKTGDVALSDDKKQGNYSFHVTNSGTAYVGFYFNSNIGDKIYCSSYGKHILGNNFVYQIIQETALNIFFPQNDSIWRKNTRIFTSDYISTQQKFRIYSYSASSAEFYADGIQLFNLTQMGALPTALATYLNTKYTPETDWVNFEDLSQEAVDEIAPDYVDSVQTVGYKFGDDSAEGVSESSIVNKGRNLWEWNSADDYDINTASSLIDNNRRIEFTTTASSQGIKPITPNGNGMVSLKPNTNYSLTVSGKCAVVVYDTADGTKIFGYANADVTSSYSFETADSTEYQFLVYNRSAGAGTYWINYIQLEEGTTATEYQPPKTYTETLPELWNMFGIEDTPDSKKFKRVKLVDAVQSGGDIDWSWHTGAPSECLVINTQADSVNYGENLITRIGDSSDTGWVENDDVEVVYNEHYLEFDGVNDYVEILDSSTLDVTTKVEIETYIKPNSTTDYDRILDTIVDSSVTWQFRFLNNHVSWVVRDSDASAILSIEGTTVINTDEWVKIKVVCDNGSGSIYINDVLEASDSVTFTGDISPRTTLRIGSYSSSTNYLFDGNMGYLSIKTDDSLAAEYKFNESGTTLKDYAGSNDGTIYGATWYDTEFDNVVETYSASPALSFDGVDDYVDCGSPDIEIDELKITAYTEAITATSSPEVIFNFGNSSTEGKIGFGSITSTTTNETFSVLTHASGYERTYIKDNISEGWHDFEIKWNGTQYDIYIDEVQKTTYFNDGGVSKITTSDVLIGANNTGGLGQYFNGSVSYLSIKTGTATTLEYTVDEGTGTILTDSSGNGNDGTIYGATWTTGLVSNPADEIELYQNPEPKLLIEHGKNCVFGDNIFLNFETTYDQYELENIIREEKNKTPTLEENEDGVFALTRNGDKIPLGSTNLPENPETRWKGYSMVNLESELPLQKVQGKGYFNSFVNVLGEDGEGEVIQPALTEGAFFSHNLSVIENNVYYIQLTSTGYLGASVVLVATMADPDIVQIIDKPLYSMLVTADYTGNSVVRCYANGNQTSDVVVSHKCVINLTEKGELPPVMQAEYGVTRWDMLDLATLNNLIGYENTITGYDDDFADVSLRNPGKNLWELGNVIPTGLHTQSTAQIGLINIKPNTTYTLSCLKPKGQNVDDRFRVYSYPTPYEGSWDLFPEKDTFLSRMSLETGIESTLTTRNDDKYLVVFSYIKNDYVGEFTNIQLEEGSVATPYEPPLPDTQTIPQGFGYAGVYDEIDFKTGTVKKYWKKTDAVADAGTYTDYKLNSIAIIIDSVTGDVKTVQSGTTTLASGFTNDVYVIYQTATPTTENLAAYKGIRLVNGTNNILADNMFIDARGTMNQRDIGLSENSVLYDGDNLFATDVNQIRSEYISTSEPTSSDGEDGDIWHVYTV